MRILVPLSPAMSDPGIQYALATLLDMAGLPFEFVDSGVQPKHRDVLFLQYGVPPQHLEPGVVIPAEEGIRWKTLEPNHTRLGGWEVLYTEQKPASLVRETCERTTLGFDILRAAFWLLSRQEELPGTERDGFDRYPCHKSWLMRHGLARVPIVNSYAQLMSRVIVGRANNHRSILIRKLPWPQGRRYAAVLSHDVDDAGRFDVRQGVRLLRRALAYRSPRAMLRGGLFALSGLARSTSKRPDPFWNFEAVMDSEQAHGFRSTFFFVSEGTNPDRDPPYDIADSQFRSLFDTMTSRGWEIGVHGNFDSYLDSHALANQRKRLACIAQSSIRGIRQHYLRFRIPETLRSQQQAGLAYDSTLGYREGIGFRAATAFPFRMFDVESNEVIPILELPLAVMDGALFWQLGLAPNEATDKVRALLQTVRTQQGMAVLLWHQRVCHEQKYPGWWQTYLDVIKYLADEAEQGIAWVATAGDVAAWWLAREAVEIESVPARKGTIQWHVRAGLATEGLVLELAPYHPATVQIRGTDAEIRDTGTELSIHLAPLQAKQRITVQVTFQEPAQ